MIRRVGVAAILAAFLFGAPVAAWAASDETYRQLDLFGDVFVRIGQDYVEEVEDQELIEAAINGMLRALDPHSSYLNPKTYRDMQVQTRGEFGGLGIEVTMENGLVKVVSPIDGTPAEKAAAPDRPYHHRLCRCGRACQTSHLCHRCFACNFVRG